MKALSSSLSPIRTITGFDCQGFSFEKAFLRRHTGLGLLVEFEKLSLIQGKHYQVTDEDELI